ncbi:hypothetical protein ASPCAL06910 [Aspergillus calidoustus]|uniref:Uncharacterized protein n=1 Tax=Aspergillus calidoustus TaxID=454130 RepID=A0A0U5G2K9_ASPCI|nr:hypothetical protein ASPCAL06910 [Aspergillus calidoustus]
MGYPNPINISEGFTLEGRPVASRGPSLSTHPAMYSQCQGSQAQEGQLNPLQEAHRRCLSTAKDALLYARFSCWCPLIILITQQ